MNNSTEKYPRDEEGNVIFPKHQVDWSEVNRWRFTYVLHEWSDAYERYLPIADLQMDKDIEEKKTELEEKDILIYKLFKIPDNPDDNHFTHHNWLRSLAHNFFKEVFELPLNYTSFTMDFDLARVILKRKTFNEISNLIKENSLEDVHDLIFYLIARIDDRYVNGIEYYERAESIKKVNNASKDAEKLIQIIQRVKPDLFERTNNPLPDISEISFKFPDIGSIRIKDDWLNSVIVGAIKSDFAEGPYKNWKKGIKRFVDIYQEDIQKQKFRYHISNSLHNLFQYLKTFQLKPNRVTSDNELICIAKILELGSLKIGNDEIPISQKKKNVRNYLDPKRHKIVTNNSIFEIRPNFEMLEKYFDKSQFQSMPRNIELETLRDGYFICERFEMQKLRPDIIFLMSYIKHIKLQRGWQFSVEGMPNENHPIIGPLYRLISPFRKNKRAIRLKSISFELYEDQNSIQINDELPLRLIERAIDEFYESHQEEFDVDIFANGSYKKPNDRFLPIICQSLYKFLLGEFPPTERDYSATEKYSEIIALILQFSHVFNNHNDDENVIKNKVIEWLIEAKG